MTIYSESSHSRAYAEILNIIEISRAYVSYAQELGIEYETNLKLAKDTAQRLVSKCWPTERADIVYKIIGAWDI